MTPLVNCTMLACIAYTSLCLSEVEGHDDAREVDAQAHEHEDDRQGPQEGDHHGGVPQEHLRVAQERQRCTKRRETQQDLISHDTKTGEQVKRKSKKKHED